MITLLITRGLIGLAVCLTCIGLIGLVAVIGGAREDQRRLEALEEHRRQQLRDIGELE